MILPPGAEEMSDEDLRAELLEVGYDEDGAEAVIEMVRSGDPIPLD